METIQSHQMPSSFLDSIGKGETLALMDRSEIVAMVIPIHPAGKPRPCGLAKGEFTVPDDFNEPLPDLEECVYGN